SPRRIHRCGGCPLRRYQRLSNARGRSLEQRVGAARAGDRPALRRACSGGRRSRALPPRALPGAGRAGPRFGRGAGYGAAGRPRRTVVLADGVLTAQSGYATGGGARRLAGVILQWGSIVARGPNLPAAIGNAVAQKAGEAVTSTDWAEARRSFERLDQARQRGDWGEFGRAYDELRRLLEGQRRAP